MPNVSGFKSNGRARLRAWQVLLAAAVVAGAQVEAPACMANPNPIAQRQPDGSVVTLHFKGDKFFNWYEDSNGYTVVRRADGYYAYAALGADGMLEATQSRAGIDDPAGAGLAPGILPDAKARQEVAAKVLPTPAAIRDKAVQRVPPSGVVRNLVVLARFSDHSGRTLPSMADYDQLFNTRIEGSGIAPTGTVRDVYQEMSYGELSLTSTIADWVTLPQTEAYYANGESGLGLKVQELMRDALAAVDPNVDFAEFDNDGDGYIDCITFVHSGYGAEWGGEDEFGTDESNRIWSHRWTLFQEFTSAEGVKVADYDVNPGLWDVGGSEISHIGVICHETGHFFGLPDLYDSDGGGEGIGSWCMMANSWGFTGDQLYPPHFSPWCKIELGWTTPETISDEGIYTIGQVQTDPGTVYKITQGFPSGEYLLIENRNKTGFDQKMPVDGGLAIWHIDDTTDDFSTEGFPGQAGWPGNGNHYRVALLQADGNYDLEKGNNRGDGGDIYNADGVSEISDTTVPSTNTYKNGTVTDSGIKIKQISAGGASMTFRIGDEPLPQVVVTQGTAVVADGSGWVEFGSTTVGGIPLARTFVVSNNGSGATPIEDLQIPAGFVATGDEPLLPATLEGGQSAAFTLTIPTDQELLLDGTVSFDASTTTETPYNFYTYDFRVSGSVTIFTPYACLESFGGWYPEEISPFDPDGVQAPAATTSAPSVTGASLGSLQVAPIGTDSLLNQTDGTPAGNVGTSSLQYVSWKSMRRDVPGTLSMPIPSSAQLVMVDWTLSADSATATFAAEAGRRVASVQTPTVRLRVGEMSNLGNGQSQDLFPDVGMNKFVESEQRYRSFHYVRKGGHYDTAEGLDDATLPFEWGSDDDPPVQIGLSFDILDTITGADPFAVTCGGQRLYGLAVERAEVYTTTRARLANPNVVFNQGAPAGFALAPGEPAPPTQGYAPFNLQHWDSRDEGAGTRATFAPAEQNVVGTTTSPLTMTLTPGAGLAVATWDTRDYASSTIFSIDGIGQQREVVDVENGVLVAIDVWLSSPQGSTANNLLPGLYDTVTGGSSSMRIGFQTDIWGGTGSGESGLDDPQIPNPTSGPVATNYFHQGRAGLFEFCASNQEQYDTAYLMEPVYALKTGARRISYFFEPQAIDAQEESALSFRPTIQAWTAPANEEDLAGQVSGTMQIHRVVVTTYDRPVLPDPTCQ